MSFRSFLKISCLFWLVTLGLASRAMGQADTGTISGVVTDATGGTVAGATVELQSVDRGTVTKAASNSSGIYVFASVQPGQYHLAVRMAGFREVNFLGLIVNTQDHIEQNFQLQLGSASESITIEGQAPLVNTSDASLGRSFDTQQVEQLPIEGRNVVELLSLQPGVTFLGGADINADKDSRSGSVNGARSDQSNVTLDGVDVNNQSKGYAFTSVLRNTQDSIQEFRVATSNANADAGRSSGAQVSLVTKSGTNSLHGSAYEYNRNAAFTANKYFNKLKQLQNGEPNARPQLVRNVFGASVGGPLKKDRLFFFANYEGRRDREGEEVSRNVPTATYRQGILSYYYGKDASGKLLSTTLTPPDIQNMDPLGTGENPAVLAALQKYPLPNDPQGGDGLNQQGFRFIANEARKFDTYIAKLDYKLTSDGRQTIFWRGNLQNDNSGGVPQFPGQPAATRSLDNSKGFAFGYTAVLDATKVNSFRWGFTRLGIENAGASVSPEASIAQIATLIPFTRSSSYKVPVHNFVDDFFWSKGKHNMQFGTNVRMVWDDLSGLTNSFSSASMTTGYLKYQGFAGKSNLAQNIIVPFDPGPAGYTPVLGGHGNQYDNGVMGLVGMQSEVTAVYNYDKAGNAVPLGQAIKRNYKWNEYDFYAQDSWLMRSNLTLTYGLRWSLLQPPYEQNGEQVGPCVANGTTCSPYSLGDWFTASAQQGLIGGAAIATPHISFAPNGSANGRPGFWNWDHKNFAPRVAVAWTPNYHEGLLGTIFGSSKQTSIRAGYALVYDHFGAATVNEYNADGSYGMTSKVQNVAGTVTAATAPRWTSFTDLPSSLLPPPPPGGFPATPSSDAFAISWGMDAGMKTPYAHTFNVSVTRELGNNTALTVAYVGRLGRRLPVQQDVAMPLNLVDPKSGVDYFSAAANFSKLVGAGSPISSIQPIPYWENLFGALTGTDFGNGPLTATQVVYSIFQQNQFNETNALFALDLPDNQSGAGVNVPGHSYPSYRFYHDQYSALYAWRTIGTSDYHALQASLHRRFSAGLQGDFNYTFAKSMDWTSQAERLPTSGGNNYAQIINTWKPDQLRGVSDYDTRHQINANWIYEMPFGRKHRFASSTHRALDTVIGGWQLNGLLRWTSGFPLSVSDGDNWPTNWDISGFATLQSAIASGAAAHVSGPHAFADPAAVLAAFRYAYPGESGTRNPLRGDGYFSLDAGLAKSFVMTERMSLRLRGDVFNATNSVRFDPFTMKNRIDNPDSFGRYTSTLTNPRVMQVALRLEF
jgi:hypothetical protein